MNAPTSTKTQVSTAQPSSGGQIDVELNMLETAIDDIINCKRAIANRLYQVTGLPADALEPVPCIVSGAGEPAPPKVPMADRMMYLRNRLEQTVRDFDQIMNRIEV
jgi:hypothetical protein